MGESILIVDDEPSILDALSGILTDEGYHVDVAENGFKALKKIKASLPSLILLDVWMPDLDGIECLKKIKEVSSTPLVIIMSGHGSIETAVKATKLGAYDFIEKPLSLEKVVLLIQHALHEKKLVEENTTLREKISKRDEMVGEGLVMKRLRDEVTKAGISHSRVLITGENGTGKELVAKAIHRNSPRASEPFIEVNCAAIPDTLIESELFGYEKGAFTGAATMKQGKFELAHGGTLFLDEIGDMSLATQAKVLRALEEQTFHRVGGTKLIHVDVRVIAASNKDLAEEIKRGAFREDLYYRLKVIPIHVPSLRDRKEDIPLLVFHFLKELSLEQGLKPKEVTKGVLESLQKYSWPGNIRELKNVVERLLIMVSGHTMSAHDVSFLLGSQFPSSQENPSPSSFVVSSFKEARAAFERNYIAEKLRENQWNISRTARVLKIERSNLYRKMKALGIQGTHTNAPPRFRDPP